MRIALVRATGVSVGMGAFIGARCEVGLGPAPARRGTLQIGPLAHLDQGVILHPWNGSIIIGSHTFLGPHVVIYGHGGVHIGKDCLIAGHVCIASSNHDIPPMGTLIRSQPDQPLPVRIGDDVWIGFGAIITGGVTIGDGCIIGAGTVVTHDLPTGAIAVGNPARILRHRS
ncbi:MAG: acyltransferase [Candidatus Methylacidiphilales bacterium]|nr:acyltransferase [Candidatus Methylacidiphilales bacterium]